MPSGFFTFPGLVNIVSAAYTRHHGISPDVISVECAPQPNLTDLVGDFTFTYDTVTIQLQDCRVDSHAISTTSRGQIWQLQLFDRRWKWAFGVLSGHYNQRDDNGEVIAERRKSMRELAELCLNAMGEQNFNVDELPDDDSKLPEINWELASPAQELASLADLCGCRVVYKFDESVKIEKLGVGSALPIDNTILENSLTLDPPELPDVLRVYSAPARYQADFRLEAVGLDTDGQIKPIADLSYMPAGGWFIGEPFLNVDAGDEFSVPRELAKETVYRWYRLKLSGGILRGLNDAPLTISGYPAQLTKREQVLPLEEIQVETELVNGQDLTKTAVVYGVHAATHTYTNTDIGKLVEAEFTIDTELGIVKFAQEVVKLDSEANGELLVEPELYLRCACPVRDPDTLEFTRFAKALVPPGPKYGTEALIRIHEDELQIHFWPGYGANADGTTYGQAIAIDHSNFNEIDDRAADLLAYLLQQFQATFPQYVTYGGLRSDLEMDGAIQEIALSVGPSGAVMSASRNSEFSLIGSNHDARRFAQKFNKNKVAEIIRAAEKDQRLGKNLARAVG